MVVIKDPNDKPSTLEQQWMLTTTDNPYNPFTQFDEWYAFDVQRGYNSSAYLARITITSPELSDFDKILAVERAIDEIIRLNILGIYIKVSRKTFKDRSKNVKFDNM